MCLTQVDVLVSDWQGTSTDAKVESAYGMNHTSPPSERAAAEHTTERCAVVYMQPRDG